MTAAVFCSALFAAGNGTDWTCCRRNDTPWPSIVAAITAKTPGPPWLVVGRTLTRKPQLAWTWPPQPLSSWRMPSFMFYVCRKLSDKFSSFFVESALVSRYFVIWTTFALGLRRILQSDFRTGCFTCRSFQFWLRLWKQHRNQVSAAALLYSLSL